MHVYKIIYLGSSIWENRMKIYRVNLLTHRAGIPQNTEAFSYLVGSRIYNPQYADIGQAFCNY